MPGLHKAPAVYITDHRDEALSDALSKTAWIDLYIDLYRQVFNETAPVLDVMADAYRRLTILEDQGIRERSSATASAWRKYGKGRQS